WPSSHWMVNVLGDSPPCPAPPPVVPPRDAAQLAPTAAKNYRRHLEQLALLSPHEAWSSRIDLAGATGDIGSPKIRRNIEKHHATVLRGAAQHYGLIERKNGDWRIKDKPPLVYHISGHEPH